jgi:hypothetical protein
LQEDSRQGKANVKSRQHLFSPLFIAALHKQMVIWGGLGFCREYNGGAERERERERVREENIR